MENCEPIKFVHGCGKSGDEGGGRAWEREVSRCEVLQLHNTCINGRNVTLDIFVCVLIFLELFFLIEGL